MAEITIRLTDDDVRRLRLRAAVELRTPENMAAYFVVKALEPKKPKTPAAPKSTKRKARRDG
jgi:plasmid stability protein